MGGHGVGGGRYSTGFASGFPAFEIVCYAGAVGSPPEEGKVGCKVRGNIVHRYASAIPSLMYVGGAVLNFLGRAKSYNTLSVAKTVAWRLNFCKCQPK